MQRAGVRKPGRYARRLTAEKLLLPAQVEIREGLLEARFLAYSNICKEKGFG